MDGILLNLRKAGETFFASRGWQSKQCPTCSQEYYTKTGNENCGSYDCVRGYAFHEIPSPKAFTELTICTNGLSRFFAEQGIVISDPIAIVRRDERTLFASTGGQIHDEFVYSRKHTAATECRFVVQPVIRLQERRNVGLIEGFSTSFIHAATECWNADSSIHLKMLDAWLSAFSMLGFYAGGLCLKLDQLDNDWAGLSVSAETISMNYQGLEVGVANFFLIPQAAGLHACLSDIGVGAERLVWAINRSKSYFDAIGPLMHMESPVVLDSVRTAVLMVGSGIHPSNRGHGSKLRTLLLRVPGIESHLNLFELVRYYHSAWRKLIHLPVEFEKVYDGILREMNRNTNIEMAGTLHAVESIDQSPEEFVLAALRKKKLSLRQFRRMTKGGV